MLGAGSYLWRARPRVAYDALASGYDDFVAANA